MKTTTQDNKTKSSRLEAVEIPAKTAKKQKDTKGKKVKFSGKMESSPSGDREAIAKRAYVIWQANGRPEDQDDAIWYQAELELLG